ncbi:hypothetical protein BS50DRAFT_572668 [Corynespora cassiicola Philippines]|uniref:Elongin-A n=1 Tax=Corynespora cassiicola Philippines TaxID=1448308 RepID=A0A2T2NQP6_CORCC|nr:hypothetical protein BS50DRAFT_572668 [Corynespora cassiicola Philippines]
MSRLATDGILDRLDDLPYTMPAPSLKELARTRLIQNVHMLTDIGDLPFHFLAPVLRHIQNPDQLMELEKNCPQIVGQTGDLWLRFIKRDIPDWEKKKHAPQNPDNWSRLYRKMVKDAEKEKEEQEAALRETMRALQKNRAGNQTSIIEANTRPGYDPAGRRRPPTFRTGGGGGGGSSWGTPGAPTKSGKAVFDKLRRGIFDQKQARPKATQMPAHLLAERKGIVRQAPARLVRMTEGEPKRMAISKGASASLAGGEAPPPMHRPRITTRPAPAPQQQNHTGAAAPKPSSLPAGQQFNVPKLQSQQAGSAGPQRKRVREEPSIFHQQKRRR